MADPTIMRTIGMTRPTIANFEPIDTITLSLRLLPYPYCLNYSIALHLFPALAGRTEREDRIREILRVCHKKQWTYDTPNMAGRLEHILAPVGFTRETTRDYVHAIMNLLEVEKETRKQVPLRLAPRPTFPTNFSNSTSRAKSHTVSSRGVASPISQVTPHKKSRKKLPQTSQLLNLRKTGLFQPPATSPTNKVPRLT